MGESFVQIIKRVGIFMVCAQMLLHFKPSESYGKYIRLLMSVMVLAQLIAPVMEIFGRQSEVSFEERILFYDEVLHQSMAEADRTGAQAQALLEKMTLEEVKSRINNPDEEAEDEETEAEGTEAKGSEREEADPQAEDKREVPAEAVGAEVMQQDRLVERIEVKLYD